MHRQKRLVAEDSIEFVAGWMLWETYCEPKFHVGMIVRGCSTLGNNIWGRIAGSDTKRRRGVTQPNNDHAARPSGAKLIIKTDSW